MIDLTRALEVAVEAARAGAGLAAGSFGRSVEKRRKRDGTWVTQADTAAEEAVKSVLAKAFPEHNILGEETGLRAVSGGPARDGAPTWVVDPIDGTNNFIAGIPIWATLVGLRVDGRSVVGACDARALGETYDAANGLGARLNGSPISVDLSVASLAAATVVFASARSFLEGRRRALFDTLVQGAERTRGFGDFWGHLLVARGAAHVMIESRLAVWDVAALEPIVHEAGGSLTDWDGAPWNDRTGVCLTTNGVLHDEILALTRTVEQGTDLPDGD